MSIAEYAADVAKLPNEELADLFRKAADTPGVVNAVAHHVAGSEMAKRGLPLGRRTAHHLRPVEVERVSVASHTLDAPYEFKKSLPDVVDVITLLDYDLSQTIVIPAPDDELWDIEIVHDNEGWEDAVGKAAPGPVDVGDLIEFDRAGDWAIGSVEAIIHRSHLSGESGPYAMVRVEQTGDIEFVPLNDLGEVAKVDGLSKRIVEANGEYCVVSEDGSRKFGCYATREAAERRLRQVEWFKDNAPDTVTPPPAVRAAVKAARGWQMAKAMEPLAEGRPVTLTSVRELRRRLDKAAAGGSASRKRWEELGGAASERWTEQVIRRWGHPSVVSRLFPEGALAAADVPGMVSKSIDEKRYTLGPMYVPNSIDAQNEWTDADELQQAVWQYVRSGDRRIRLQHNKDIVAGEWVECMAWPYEVTVPLVAVDGTVERHEFPANTVFLGVVWEPWAWDMVKGGSLRGYSIGGSAARVLADLPNGS